MDLAKDQAERPKDIELINTSKLFAALDEVVTCQNSEGVTAVQGSFTNV
jgi:hypothetical protein